MQKLSINNRKGNQTLTSCNKPKLASYLLKHHYYQMNIYRYRQIEKGSGEEENNLSRGHFPSVEAREK